MIIRVFRRQLLVDLLFCTGRPEQLCHIIYPVYGKNLPRGSFLTLGNAIIFAAWLSHGRGFTRDRAVCRGKNCVDCRDSATFDTRRHAEKFLSPVSSTVYIVKE